MLPQFDKEERAVGSTEFFNFAFKIRFFKRVRSNSRRDG